MSSYLFTSESVSEGHPDKVCDQISDAILDAVIAQDPLGRVACETLVKTGMVIVAGELTTSAWVDIEALVRQTLEGIGYVHSDCGFDARSCAVLCAIGKQSGDISMGVDCFDPLEQGAGDQGIMFGYACDETDTLMPSPITYAHRLMHRQALVRKKGTLSFLQPDAKSQVTFVYENHVPTTIDSIVLSTQHLEDVSMSDLKEGVMEEIIKKVIPEQLMTKETKIHINPTGRFVLGGPLADCGLTGRKIIVDTYGGVSRHGGGAFSGKDPSKVDRSGAYMARYVAKHVVASGLASRCEVQLAYVIGLSRPASVYINTFATGRISDVDLSKRVLAAFDFRPGAIIRDLDLLRPIYAKTASYGHFGRNDVLFPWETIQKNLNDC